MSVIHSEQGDRLGITHKGIGVVEHYLMARRLMVRNIYHNQKKLAIESFLIFLLRSLAESLDDFSAFKEIKNNRLGKFLCEANLFNQSAISSTTLDQTKQQFLEKNFSNYKELCDYDIFSVIKYLAYASEKHVAADIAKRLHHRVMPKIVRLDHIDNQSLKTLILEFKSTYKRDFADWQINLFQTPHQSYSGEEDPLLIINERDKIQPLNEISQIIHAISDKYEHTTFLYVDQPIFSDPRVSAFIEKLGAVDNSLG